jgi:polyisoprenoid-binding protein YceI
MKKNKWLVDPAHSEVYFKVKHLMITTVTGYFRKFNIEAYTEDDDFATISGIGFTANIDSIDTNNVQRDEHLKSSDFFNTNENEYIKFVGLQYDSIGNGGTLSGNLTIRGITKLVIVNVEFGGIVVDGYSQTKAGFTVNGKLSRKEFGLTWGAITEAGNVVVGDEVKYFAEIQLIKQNQE